MDLREYIHWLQRENNPRRQTALTFSYLGKLGATKCRDLQKCKNHLQSLLFQSILQISVSKYPLIIGLTESGIIPSALMHQNARGQGIKAQWLCSTRRPAAGICFSESHSHSPNHVLPMPQQQPTELWFVEDEITTGRTILNLALRLCSLLSVNYIRVFTLADTRPKAQIELFDSILADSGIHASTHTLIQKELQANTELNLLSIQKEQTLSISNCKTERGWHFCDRRPALKAQSGILSELPNNLSGLLLVVGEAIDLGMRLVQINPLLSFQHITLSPWKIDNTSVFSKLQIYQQYYLYNYNKIETPVYILSDPSDESIELEAKCILSQQGIKAKNLQLNSLIPAI